MQTSSKTARPYAIAAFKQAQHEAKTSDWAEMLRLLAAVIGDRAMARLIVNPKVGADRLADLVIGICGDRLSDTGRNFVRILARNRRLGLLGDISRMYDAERARAERRNDVEVTSARELTESQAAAIREAMTQRLGTTVDLATKVDPELIGGVIIRCGDTVVDASIRGRLNKLAQAIT